MECFRKTGSKSLKFRPQTLCLSAVVFLLLLLLSLYGLMETLLPFLLSLCSSREGIKPALSPEPVAHLRHKTTLFALPVFRRGKTPDAGYDFLQGRKLPTSQELVPGHTRKALGFLFGVQIPDGFKILSRRRHHTPRRRRMSRFRRYGFHGG